MLSSAWKKKCSGPLTIPTISPGTYYGAAIVDDQSQVEESDESNNRLTASNTITLAGVQNPDLIVTSVSIPFFFNDTATTEIYTLSLHDALPISGAFRMSFYLSSS